MSIKTTPVTRVEDLPADLAKEVLSWTEYTDPLDSGGPNRSMLTLTGYTDCGTRGDLHAYVLRFTRSGRDGWSGGYTVFYALAGGTLYCSDYETPHQQTRGYAFDRANEFVDTDDAWQAVVVAKLREGFRDGMADEFEDLDPATVRAWRDRTHDPRYAHSVVIQHVEDKGLPVADAARAA